MSDALELQPSEQLLEQAPPIAARRRRPWLAAILSFIVPGLGHQYTGRLRTAGLLYLLFQPLEVVSLLLMLPIPAQGVNVAVPFALAVVARVVLAVSVALDVSHAPVRPAYRLSRWYGLAAAVVLLAGAGKLFTTPYRAFVAEFYSLAGHSMEPTILEGERILVSKWDHGWRLPFVARPALGGRRAVRGELVVFAYPKNPRLNFLQRIVGLPGERLEIRGKRVFVDGRLLEEPYAHFIQPPDPDSPFRHGDDLRPITVPTDSYIVLGDNRDNSNDSRSWGLLPAKNLRGRVRLVFWSWDPATGSVRWNRIGLRLD